MSDSAEHPDRSERAEDGAQPPPDPDAWAEACAEDLAAERARRRARYGPEPGSAAEELRRLAEAVGDRLAEFGRPLLGSAGTAAVEGVAKQFARQAKDTVDPVLRRNPEVVDHLAAAGGELLAAYRAAVGEAERRWTERAGEQPPAEGPSFEKDGPEPSERQPIDLDDPEDPPPSGRP
ncbi:DUF5304 family protein [Streptomyces sulphureus]|uniref:DUF5304 family protein n=1 Tax=Streptomyces sulphureus TaxID=47758 RepID=UPI000371C070|nr:DUF5304 family protein [Streptomyces sulphureus]